MNFKIVIPLHPNFHKYFHLKSSSRSGIGKGLAVEFLSFQWIKVLALLSKTQETHPSSSTSYVRGLTPSMVS